MSFVNQVRHHWPIAVLSGVGAAGLIYLVVKASEHPDDADSLDNLTSDDESVEPLPDEKEKRGKCATVKQVTGRRASSYVQVPSMGIDLGDLAGWFHRVIPSSDYINNGMVPKRYDSMDNRLKRVTKNWTPRCSFSHCIDRRRTIKCVASPLERQGETAVGESQAKAKENSERFTKHIVMESGVGEKDSTVYSQIKEIKDKNQAEAATNVAMSKTGPSGSHENKKEKSRLNELPSFPTEEPNDTNMADSMKDSSEADVETRASESFIEEKSSAVFSDQSVQMNNNRKIVDISSDSNNGFEDTKCDPMPSHDPDTQVSLTEKYCEKCSDKSQSDSYRSALECTSSSRARTSTSLHHSDMFCTKAARLNEASNDEKSSASNKNASSDFMSTEMSESIEFVSRRLADIVTMANLGASTATTGKRKKYSSSTQSRLSHNTYSNSALLNEEYKQSKPKHTFTRSISTPNVAIGSKYEIKRKTSVSDVEESPSMVEFERLEKECIKDSLPVKSVHTHKLSKNLVSANNRQRRISSEHGDASACEQSSNRKLQIEHAKRLTKVYLDELLDKLNSSKTCGECRKTKDSKDSGITVTSLMDERSSSNRSLEETLRNIVSEADESLSKLYRYDALGETLNGTSLLEEILEAAVIMKAQDSSGTSISNIVAAQPSSDNSIISNILPPTRLGSSTPKSASASPVKSLLKGNLFPFEKPVKDIASKVKRDAKFKKSKKVSIGHVSIIGEAPAKESIVDIRVGKRPSKIPQLKVLTKRSGKQGNVFPTMKRLKVHQSSKIPRLSSPFRKQETLRSRDFKKLRGTQISMIPTRRRGVGCTPRQVMMVNAVEFGDLSFLKDLLSCKLLQKETKACGDSKSNAVHSAGVKNKDMVTVQQRDKHASQNDIFASLKNLKISKVCDHFEHKTMLEPSWKSPFKRHVLPLLWVRNSEPLPKCTKMTASKRTNSLPPIRRKRLRTKRELDENLRKVKSLDGLSKMTDFDCQSNGCKQRADNSVPELDRLQQQSGVALSRDSAGHDCLCVNGEVSNENYLEESLEKIIQETNDYLNNLFNGRYSGHDL